MHYLYVLACSGGHLYVGVTVDPRARIAAHEQGSACRFTEEHPVERMVYIEPFQEQAEAERVERRLVRHLVALRHPRRVAGGPLTGYEQQAEPTSEDRREAKRAQEELGAKARAHVYAMAREPPPLEAA